MSRRKTSFSHILKGFRWLPEREGPHTLTPIYGAHSIYMGGHLSPFPGLPPSPFRPVGKNWAFISGRKKSHKVFLRRPRHIFPHCLMGPTNASGCHISWESNLSRPKRTLRVGWANPRFPAQKLRHITGPRKGGGEGGGDGGFKAAHGHKFMLRQGKEEEEEGGRKDAVSHFLSRGS